MPVDIIHSLFPSNTCPLLPSFGRFLNPFVIFAAVLLILTNVQMVKNQAQWLPCFEQNLPYALCIDMLFSFYWVLGYLACLFLRFWEPFDACKEETAIMRRSMTLGGITSSKKKHCCECSLHCSFATRLTRHKRSFKNVICSLRALKSVQIFSPLYSTGCCFTSQTAMLTRLL